MKEPNIVDISNIFTCKICNEIHSGYICFKRYRQDIENIIEKLRKARRCHQCPDKGYFIDGPADDPEQVQCEFCYTEPNSFYNVSYEIMESLK